MRTHLALATLLVCSVATASGHPNLARGFEPEKLYQFNDVDSINVHNGNLSVTVPLGQEFKGNGTLRYRFSLVYNSKAWDFERKYYNGSAYTKGMFNKAVPSKSSNAGMGWMLTLGRLIAPQDPSNDPASPNGHEWTFQDASGAVHRFPGTYAATDPASPVHTKDSSFLRLSKPATNTRDVAHPDGTVYRFIEGGNQYWLYQIFDAFNNYLRIRYYDAAGAEILTTSSYGNAMSWKAIEYTNANALVRTHTVRFENRAPLNAPSNYLRQVKWVDLAGFNGGTSSYELVYSDTVTAYGCGGDWRDNTYTPDPTVPMLMSVYLPDGSTQSTKSRYQFTYYNNDCTGSLASMVLPTLGKIVYSYNFYQLPTSACLNALSTSPDTDPQQVFSTTSGVTRREVYNPLGTKIREQTYAAALQLSGYTYFCPNGTIKNVHGTSVVTVEDEAAWNNGKRTRTEHSFSVWPDISAQGPYSYKDYAAPYTRATCPAGNGLCLSTRTFDCTSGNCGTRKQETYVQYEGDNGNSPDLANRRLARSRTVHLDDGDRFVETKYSGFDGHGHYRKEETFTGTGATSAGTLLRTRFTNYNPTAGTTTVDPVTWTPSSTATTIAGTWILNTYTDGYVQQHSGGTLSTERAQYCFSAQGLMTRHRRMRSTGITSSDLLNINTYDTLGNRTREEFYGGDLHSLGTTATCSVAPTHNTHTYRIDHTWSFGHLATSRYVNGSTGVGLSHYDVDREIDQNTGLVKAEWSGRSPGLTDGIKATFEYDALGRRTWTKPAAGHDAWTQLTYTRATSASAPANVLLQHYANNTTTTPIAQARYEFDGFGRLLREGMLGASGAWMYRETLRDGSGRVTSVSEWDSVTSPVAKTSTIYDWAGRPTSITPPSGSATTFAYTGARLVSRTQLLATAASGTESPAVTVEERDLLGRLVSVTEPNSVKTNYTYDLGDRLRQVCMNWNGSVCGQTRTFTYDARGLLVSEQHPEKSTTEYFNFDSRGNPTQSYVGSSLSDFAHIYAFDRAARPTTVTQTATGRLIKEFTYGTTNPAGNRLNGKLQTAKRWNWHDRFSIYGLVTETYTYGGRGGRPSSRQTAVETFDYAHVLAGQKLFDQTWTWNDLGDPLVTGYPLCSGLSPCNVAGARNITHDYANGWLTNVREGTSSWGSITYHGNGMVDTVTHNNLVQSVYALDPQKMQRPASVTAKYGTTTYWTSGTYLYDSSGNVRAMGNDYYVYDLLGRLTQGTSERASSTIYKQQNQTYDVYGNITNIATVINGSTTNRAITVTAASNRLTNASYDIAGNQLTWDGIYTYGYDSQNMMRSLLSSNRDILYLYTADDERVWEYDLLANRSDYTIRDLDKKVLRVFDENNGVWAWKKDMIHRAGAILGSASYAGSYHYTVDHLGTPRYISNASRGQVGKHAYYPFGQESTSDSQNQEFAKFTGHERDTNFTNTLDYLDYMHARHYNPMLGRFMSVDPASVDLRRPQAWNRYLYSENVPIGRRDPDGRLSNPVTREQGKGAPIVFRGGQFGQIRELQPGVSGSAGGEYGARRAGGKRTHRGIDIVAPVGTPLVAAFTGVAYEIRQDANDNPLGLSVFVRGKDGIVAIYSHLDSTTLKAGATVTEGQTIGEAGRSGNVESTQPSSEDHVHFQMYGTDGKITDPELFLNNPSNQRLYQDPPKQEQP